MPLNYAYPTSTQLQGIEQDLIPLMTEDDPVFFKELFPMEDADTEKLEWEQYDNFFGEQQARGYNGAPSPVARTGLNRFSVQPGVYGEYVPIDEQEISTRGAEAKFTGVIDLTKVVMMEQRKLLQRRLDRIRRIGWALLTTGQFVVSAPGGGYEHRDRYIFDTIVATPGFSNSATSTPFTYLLDLPLQTRGTSSTFDQQAKIYCNKVTINRILVNTNAADLGGRFRINGGDTVNDIKNLNAVLAARGCPQLVEYDLGSSTTANTRGTFGPFIPNGIGVLIGRRPANSPIGSYRMTQNANNDLQPGPYSLVIDNAGREIPRRIEIHDGHNGGPVIFFPSAVKILNLG